MRNNFNLFEVLAVSAGKTAFQKLLLFSVTLMLLTISFSSVARPEYVVGLTQQGIRIATVEEVELGFNYELEKISKDKDYALKIKVFSSDVELNNMLQARKIKGYFGSPMMFFEMCIRDRTTCLCQKIDAAEMYEQLSLNDAIGIALKNNVEQRISLQAAAVAESQYQEAVSAHWPTVSLQASMTRMDEDPTFSLPGATVSRCV